MKAIKFTVSDAEAVSAKADALVVTVAEGKHVSKAMDKLMGGAAARMNKSGEFTGKAGQVARVHVEAGPQVIMIGTGAKEKSTPDTLRQAGGRAASALKAMRARTAAYDASTAQNLDAALFAEGLLLGAYEYTRYKKPNDNGGPALASCAILAPAKAHAALRKGIRRAEAIARGVALARDLVNTPARDLTPTDMERAARKVKGVTLKVLGQKECEALGMGAYLSVARGSAEQPRFIVAMYAGGRKGEAPVALVGKSITFDSGGLSLKPSAGMEKMKYDMAGGAAVLGALQAIAELGLKVNVTGILPATENLPAAKPSKPGDVVRAMGGKTIEVLNTDAEGRLALADALGYAIKMVKPREIIDLATLTGACSVTFGEEAMALFSNDDALAARIAKASDATNEKAWRMPLYEEYADYIKSGIADLQNISNTKSGGLVTSGYFLKEFVGETPWAHLDIASTAWTERAKPYSPKGASGIGVRLLVAYLEALA
jgi:leucyl aminopeptidase